MLAALVLTLASGPNFLVIRADQLRASALGCYGDPVARTPRIDELADRGIRFSNAVSSMPVCSAHRTAFDTGLYTHATPNADMLDPGDSTLHGLLSAAGYSTFRIGKWHQTPEALEIPGFPETVPASILGGVDYHAGHEQKHDLINGSYWINGSTKTLPAGGWRPQKYVDLAKAHLQRLARTGEPFYGVIDLEPPHTPYIDILFTKWDVFAPGDVPLNPNVPAPLGFVTQAQLARYYSMVFSVDDMVGQLLDHLERLELDDDTVVLFLSDHGAHVGAHGYLTTLNQKRSPYEESIKIPCIWADPDGAHGVVDDGLIGTVDFFVGILERAGLTPPADAHALQMPAGAHLLMQLNPLNAPDGAWVGVLRQDGVKYARSEQSGAWVLFDTVRDPFELDNLIGRGDPREAEMFELLQKTTTAVGYDLDW